MPRRPPPRDYYEEDEEDEIYEMDRERRPRRDRGSEDVEYSRRRSEPLAEDMERMHIRERPRRDFMKESFERPREEVDMVLQERSMPLDREEDYMRRSSVSWGRPRPREIDENLIVEERGSRRGSRRKPREIDEALVEERERDGDRMRRSVPDLEEDDLMVPRERRRGSRRQPRGIEDDDMIIEEREMRRRSRRRPERRSEDDLLIEERERRRGSRRHPERRSEDDLIFEESERRQSRRHPEREIEEDLIIEQPRKHGRRRRPQNEFEEEEMLIRRREKEQPLRRGWDSERDMRSQERRFELDEEEIYSRSRPRPPPANRVDVEEVMLDDARLDRRRSLVDRSERDFEEEDLVIRRKGKDPQSVDRGNEEIIFRERRGRRRSAPSENVEGEMRGLRRGPRPEHPLDEEADNPLQFDARSRPRELEEEEEDIHIRRTKNKPPSRRPSPSMDSIHVPPIHQDVFTHHRHIDHGYEEAQPPLELRPRSGSINEIDIRHRSMRNGRLSEEDIVLKHRDSEESLAPEDSISPTNVSSPGFSDPWERGTSQSRHRSRASYNETKSSSSGTRKPARSVADLEELDIETLRELNRESKGKDDWSLIHAPTAADAIEMSGALDIVEIEPRHAPIDQVETGRIAQQVADVKDPRDSRWTEITKKLVVKEAIERMGYEYEETRTFYYIFSYLQSEEIEELVELSDEIRSARRRRIRDIQQERSSSIPAPAPPRIRPLRMGMPPQARMLEKRMRHIREREWMYEPRR